MFGWFKKLFSGKVVEDVVTPVDKTVEPPLVQEEPASKPAPKKKAPVKTTASKPKPKKKKVVVPDLGSMTKVDLDIYAKSIGLQVDKRKNKDTMIKQIEDHLNKEN